MNAILRVTVAILLLPLHCFRAEAADFNWKSAVSGQFSTATNWQPSGPPGLSDTAIFDLGSAGYEVSGGAPVYVDQIKVGNDTLTLFGGSYSSVDPVLPGFDLGLQSGDTANLTLDFATLRASNIWIGDHAGAQATVTVDSTAELRTDVQILPPLPPGEIVVGASGTGTLLVNSGTVNTQGATIVARDAQSQGTLNVSGNHGMLTTLGSGLTVGQGGNGSLAISGGAKADIAGAVMVGQEIGSQGGISIGGAGSVLETPGYGSFVMTSMTIGGAGQGALSVTSGGKAVLAGPLVVGQDVGAQGSIMVDGANSLLEPAGYGSAGRVSLTLGASGQGAMSVTGGATAKLGGPIVLGDTSGAHGSLTVSGVGSKLQSAGYGNQEITGMTVGASGTGTFFLGGGAIADLTSAGMLVGQSTGASGSVMVDGIGTQLTVGNLLLGGSGSGFMSVTGGAKANAFFPMSSAIGYSPGSSGLLTVSGIGSQMSLGGLVVGQGGSGTFNVNGGGAATSSGHLVVATVGGSQGHVSVDGPNSQISFSSLTVGGAGLGTLSVTNGGTANFTDSAAIGSDPGSFGNIHIDGPVSTMSTGTSAGTITVGQEGVGQLTITNRGSFAGQNFAMIVGDQTGSQGTVTVSGRFSNLSVHGNVSVPMATTMIIGQHGTGTLNATDGAVIDSGPVYVGYTDSSSGGVGALHLDGAHTSMAVSGGTSASIIGNRTTGSVSITGGASWTTDSVYVGNYGGGIGSVAVNGVDSVWKSNQSIYLGNNGGQGSLTVSGGGYVSASNALINESSSLVDIENGTLATFVTNYGNLIDNGLINGNVKNDAGVLSGTGTIAGTLTQHGGTVSPGNSPGILTAGALDFQSGIFRLEINSAGGTAGGPVGWDLLACQGAASMYGIMTLDLVSLTPANDLGSLVDFNPAQSYHWTFLTAGAGITHFMPVAVTIDTSGFFNPYSGQFYVSQVGNSLQLNYSVPEPSSAVLALLAVGLLAFRRRRAR